MSTLPRRPLFLRTFDPRMLRVVAPGPYVRPSPPPDDSRVELRQYLRAPRHRKHHLRAFDPRMLRVVTPGPVRAAFAGQNPGVIQRIAGARHHRMIAAWN